MSGGGRTADATVSVRNKETQAEHSTDWGLARSRVSYESRLELARLLYADFDAAVHGIVAQPFLLAAAGVGQPGTGTNPAPGPPLALTSPMIALIEVISGRSRSGIRQA